MSRKGNILKKRIRQAAVVYNPKEKNRTDQKIGLNEAGNVIRPKSATNKFDKKVQKAISHLKDERLTP